VFLSLNSNKLSLIKIFRQIIDFLLLKIYFLENIWLMDIEVTRTKPNILITGTPGTGKTTLSKLLSEYIEGF
jgi:Cdc6-like AAA superfamily ATPase